MNHKVHEDHEAHKEGVDITPEIIRLGIKVHRALGPGLLEDVYEECLCWEFSQNGLAYARQIDLPLLYEGVRLRRAYRADIIVQDTVLLEIKSIDHILPVHESQVLTYLRLSGSRIGLLMNFNNSLLKNGLRRFKL